MYPVDLQRLGGLRSARRAGVAANVYLLGLTSLLTDVSSEMVAAILPIYMVVALQLSPLQFGLVDALYQASASVARLAGGPLADRWRRDRAVAAAGYGLSAVCKLGLLAAGSAWGAISLVLALDRAGKGLRSAPRDALITLSTAPERLGLAFGVHRALDTTGALLGPVLAFVILALLPQAFDVVIVCSFFIALVGLAVLLCFVRGVRRSVPALAGRSGRSVAASVRELLRDAPYRRVLGAGCLLGVVSIADPFVYLLLQRRTGLDLSWFPLYAAATAGACLLLAVPAGRLGDRIGRMNVFVLGHGLLLAACLLLLWPAAGHASLAALLLLGGYYACTDGLLMAAAGARLPEARLATGLALLATATGLARAAGSIGFGAVWQTWGADTALLLYAALLALVLLPCCRRIAGEHLRRDGTAVIA